MRLSMSLVLLLLCFRPVAEEAVAVWSGREVVLPGNGAWRLESGHGRILASGNGEVRFELPPMTDGTSLDTVLVVNGEKRKVRVWAPRLLNIPPSGIPGLDRHLLSPPPPAEGANIRAGNEFDPESRPGKILLVFPDKRDFPLELGGGWERIAWNTARLPGCLGLSVEKRERCADVNGTGSYIELEKKGKRVFLFSPLFDFDKIENILLIQKLIKESAK